MRLPELLQKLFLKSRGKLDKRLHFLLLESVQTLVNCKCLSIFGLGRALNRKAEVKHNIKTIDRLFGNKNLHNHRLSYFKTCTQWILQNKKRPVIIVDWSGLTRCGKYHFIRASVPVKGRALPILDMTFERKDCATPSAHNFFIKTLKTILPPDCKPIIITDAGFRNPWFKLICKQGWDFIGRVRNRTTLEIPGTNEWEPVKALYSLATTKAKYLFRARLAKSNPITGHLYFICQIKQNRKKKNVAGRKVQCSRSLKYAKRGNEPWLITSSISPEELSANQIIKLYRKRMQIEEGFRDLKNTRNGFSLRHCRSYTIERLDTALLIAALAMLLLWVIGFSIMMKGKHLSYQANSVKNRNILSIMIIAWQAIRRNDIRMITSSEFNEAIVCLALLAASYE